MAKNDTPCNVVKSPWTVIRTLRLQAGFTQASLAEKLEVTPNIIHKLENREIVASLFLREKLKTFFCKTLEELFYPDGAPRLDYHAGEVVLPSLLPVKGRAVSVQNKHKASNVSHKGRNKAKVDVAGNTPLVKALRVNLKLTQQQLADKLSTNGHKFTRWNICDVERGRYKASKEIQKAYADFFKVDKKELFTIKKESKKPKVTLSVKEEAEPEPEPVQPKPKLSQADIQDILVKLSLPFDGKPVSELVKHVLKVYSHKDVSYDSVLDILESNSLVNAYTVSCWTKDLVTHSDIRKEKKRVKLLELFSEAVKLSELDQLKLIRLIEAWKDGEK